VGIIRRNEDEDGIVTLTLDDGKLNAFDNEVFRELDAEIGAASGARAVLLAGREGVFTAGLNTKVLRELDATGLSELLTTFGRTMMSVWLTPLPVVAACTGHAIAAGTMLAMACDHAVAARGEFRWGLTETQIGFPLPRYAITLARANVRRDRFDDLLLPGATVGPEDAVSVGFADELADPGDVLTRARERASELADLPRGAYAATKRRLRGAAAQNVLEELDEDVRELVDVVDPGGSAPE
jgi:enoyl-CoA hydratase